MSCKSTARTAETAPTPKPVFRCGVCDRSFKRPDHLARHERAHSNTRPFRCSLCSRTFGRRDILLRHASHVHGITKHNSTSTSTSDNVQAEHSRSSSIDARSSTASDSLPEPAEDREEAAGAAAAVAWAESEEQAESAAAVAYSAADDAERSRTALASLGESDLNQLIDFLPTLSSYAGLAQVFQYGLPIKTRAMPSAANWPVVLDAGLPEALREGLGHAPTRLSLLSSAIRNVPSLRQPALSSVGMPSPAKTLSPPTPCSSLTKPVYDRLLQVHQDHFTALHPVFHYPSIDFSFETFTSERPQRSCTQEACGQWKRKPHRTLVMSILALGAVGDHRRDLALDLYTQTRKEILSWLSKIKRVDSGESLPLDFFQAFLNYIAFGLSFGDKAMEQLTLGHTVSLRGLIGLAGFEKPQCIPPLKVHLICPNCQAKAPVDWLAWIQAEERKRTLFSYFTLMSSALTYLDSVPTMDWREIQHELPCSEELWVETDPSAWRLMLDKEPRTLLFRTAVQSLFPASVNGRHVPNPSFIQSSAGNRLDERKGRSVDRFSSFLLITALHREAFCQRMNNAVDVEVMQSALLQWQTLWPSFPTEDDATATDTLFSCSIAMFDNTQLLVHVDVSEAREALVSREYGKFCVTFSSLDLRLDSDGSGCSLSSARDDWQQTFDIFFDPARRSAFRHIARYSVNALEIAFRCNPRPNPANPGLSMSLLTGIAVFHCIHLLSSWMCFFANCLNRRLYTTRFSITQNHDHLEDVKLLEDILVFARNRKVQFNAAFSVPESPDSLNEKNVGRLARDMLGLLSNVFSQCLTMPAFSHLGQGLKARSVIISDWVKNEMVKENE